MLASGLGFLLLVGVVFVSVLERGQTEIHYFDWHAAAVVVGGVCGSLLVAVKGSTFSQMLKDWFHVTTGRDPHHSQLAQLSLELNAMESAWREGRRNEVLKLVDSPCDEVRVAADALVQHLSGEQLRERFEHLRLQCSQRLLPQIEGWDMVARLSPSFGIVGTVAGMVQLFRNMATSTGGGLGGAMAMALLATLYGILLGTAVGGPMSTRVNLRLNENLGLIDLLERKVSSLIDEVRQKRVLEKV